MSLYAIGDLHLSFSSEKPMDIFGEQWERHYEKIEQSWKLTVSEDDTILIPGDISWAISLQEASKDLEWIHKLPGKKIFIKGNHDYWWTSLTKINGLYDNMMFIQNTFETYEDYAICGTRGWNCPGSYHFTQKDNKIYNREANRLKLSLEAAKKAGYDKIICMLHYPPTNEKFEPSLFTEVIKEHEVEQVIYGHLHGKDAYNIGLQGEFEGIHYKLTSCDYLDFKPLKIL
ncbi:metallophosphoesterase [Serpentinicella sp. ANB-PHB4]|uniref:metallophosphoesterase n=1 Tax=Serpentinicella sp. ANB-PHB4 TaxID=3074076 RepID=UPI002867121D|nr:metallophosphoesterase [Serpentinicella sp. ANB-PHB4]MDR5658535.1 metallophosphoesterase [Serpentinicella sp. ANB-PHB4]